jgi:UbiD family decarboxylase
MICATLREVLVDLEQRGKLIRVSKSVDISWEVACLVKWMFQAVEEPNRRGLWFDNIAGHNIPVVIGAWVYQPKSMRISLALFQRK